jgi:hypothetical protein
MSTSGITGRDATMKQFIGALFIASQIAASAAVAQVSEQIPEATAEPAARAAAQNWVNRRGKQGDTELHWMAFKGDAAGVRRLLKGGADVNKEVDNGNSPLHLAAYKGHTEVVGILIENGADIDARNDAGFTALDWARRKDHREVERVLLAHAATVGGQSLPESAAVKNPPATVTSKAVRPQASPPQGAAGRGNYRIQLGSFNSRQAAIDTWERCRRHYAGVLGNLEMQFETVDLQGRVYHRLQTGGFSVDAARVVCAELEHLGQPCIVVSPTPHEPRKVGGSSPPSPPRGGGLPRKSSEYDR